MDLPAKQRDRVKPVVDRDHCFPHLLIFESTQELL